MCAEEEETQINVTEECVPSVILQAASFQLGKLPFWGLI